MTFPHLQKSEIAIEVFSNLPSAKISLIHGLKLIWGLVCYFLLSQQPQIAAKCFITYFKFKKKISRAVGRSENKVGRGGE